MHLHQVTLEESPNDNTFVQSLTEAADNTNLLYPPVAFVESVADVSTGGAKIRRLHLIIVDLWRPWKVVCKRVADPRALQCRVKLPNDITANSVFIESLLFEENRL